MFKKIPCALPWHDKDELWWPEDDEKLVAVLDQVADLERIVSHVAQFRSCVQAGGAVGVWPLRFAQLFERVYTFEPLVANYKAMKKNIRGVSNIAAFNAPLTNDDRAYSIHRDAFERKNYGAGYIVPDVEGIPALRIDSLNLEDCDLIQLDVEGSELDALMGGRDTIDRCRPVICLEEKKLNHKKGDPAAARKWLEREFNYQLVEAIHRDVILAC